MKFIVNCITELNKVAKTIIESIDEKNVICFYGKMGVGKTALIKDICSELGVKENVSSPTFSIVNGIFHLKENLYSTLIFIGLKMRGKR